MLIFFAQAAAIELTSTPAETVPAKVDTVIVTARPPEVRDKIDRRIYDVRSDAGAQGGVVLDILNRIPSVTVSPTGKVALRGDTGVTIMVNGKPPANGSSTLLALPTSSVERVEVMTNPSAQFSPDGTSGIINIITRREHALGLSGTLSTRINTQDQFNVAASATAKKGDWTIDARLAAGRSPTDVKIETTQRDATTDAIIVTRDNGGAFSLKSVLASLSATSEISEQSELTLEANHVGGRIRGAELTRYKATGSGSDSQWAEAKSQRASNSEESVGATYTNTWPEDRGSLEASFEHTITNNKAHIDYEDSSLFLSNTVTGYGDNGRTHGPDDEAKLEVVINRTSGAILTAGIGGNRIERDFIRSYDGGTAALGLTAGDLEQFQATRSTLASYATYQFQLARFKVMPGLRVETEELRLTTGVLSRDHEVTRLFPSLHVSHAFAGGKIKASYSRRILRPDLNLFDPRRTPLGKYSAYQGNMDLKPTTTDSMETGYDRTIGKATYGLTVYYRVSHDPWQDYTTSESDLTLSRRPLNYSRSHSGGLEFSARGEVLAGLKYVANINVYEKELVPEISKNITRTSYSGNALLEKKRKGGDQYQINLSFSGKSYTLQGYQDAFYQIDATYSHKLTSNCTVSMNVVDLLNSNRYKTHYRDRNVVVESALAPNTRALKLSLVYKFKS